MSTPGNGKASVVVASKPESEKKPVRKVSPWWWCTPCQKWVRPLRPSPSAPPMCPKCRSGRVRPAAAEDMPPDPNA